MHPVSYDRAIPVVMVKPVYLMSVAVGVWVGIAIDYCDRSNKAANVSGHTNIYHCNLGRSIRVHGIRS